jgi:hypothetical protein
MGSGGRTADIECMAAFGFAPQWWTWRTSAHTRAASLVLLWALLLTSPVLGPLTWPVIVVRLVLSSVQMVLNSALGRVEPLEGRTRADWLLFALTFFLACAASEVGKAIGDPHSPLLLAAVALPYSGIQLRTLARSHRAAAKIELKRETTPVSIAPVRRAA